MSVGDTVVHRWTGDPGVDETEDVDTLTSEDEGSPTLDAHTGTEGSWEYGLFIPIRGLGLLESPD